MRESLLRALNHPSIASRGAPLSESSSSVALEAATRAAKAAPTSDYGLDPSADADIGLVETDHIDLVQERLDDQPEAVMDMARQLWDSEVTEGEVREALERARAVLLGPEAEPMLEATRSFEKAVGMPQGWGFEGYDPLELPIAPMDRKFETVADATGYALAFVAANTVNAFKKKAPFRYHDARNSFVYDMPVARTKLALLGDFGNGLAHSRYIAKHIRAMQPEHLLYVGDVYYAGTSSEFGAFVAPELEPMLTRTNVMMLTSNHEMYSKAYPYFSYLDHRRTKGDPQKQQGAYFCLRFGDAFQIVGVDTDYYGHLRFNDMKQRAWLSQVLREGRARGAINILLTANEPYDYGDSGTTKLLADMKPYMRDVDLWFWGNTHYCGLFDATPALPMASCIGHGGYPYRLSENDLDEDLYQAPCPATPLFLETQPRYFGTKLRPELGNNGFVMMELEPGGDASGHRVRLEYIDWMKRPRYRAELGRRNGKLVMLKGEEVP